MWQFAKREGLKITLDVAHIILISFNTHINPVIELSKWRWGVEIFCRWGSREEVGGVEIFFHTGLKKRWGSNFVINYRRKR